MAFDKNALACISSQQGVAGSPTPFNIYCYATNDAAATVEADGYFDGAVENGLNKGDIIFASMVRNGTLVTKSYHVSAGGADVAIAAF